MNIFPGSSCSLRALLLIVFTWNVRGQTQGGGVSIGLDADYMMDTAFGELPSPLVAMAAEGAGTGLGGSGQGSSAATSSQTGSGLNTQSFSMSGLDHSSVHQADTPSIVGVASGQTIFLPGFPANNILSGSPIILPATTTSHISTATDPNTDYVLRNEEFTALGKVGHLVKVPIDGVVAQESTSKIDTATSTFLDGLSISADGALTINPSHIIGVADMSQMGASGTANIYNFKPGTSHASELHVLQASKAGKAVDMTDMLPPPLDHDPAHPKPNLKTNTAKDITSVNNTSLNVVSIDNQHQKPFSSLEFSTMEEVLTLSESGTTSSLTPITDNKRPNTLPDLSNSVASLDQSMIHINEESMFNEISSNNQTDFLTVYDQSVPNSNVRLGSLDQWLAGVNDPIALSTGSLSNTLVDKASLNTLIQTDIMNPNVNVNDKMQSKISTGLTDQIITGIAPTKHVDITKALHEQNKFVNVNNDIAQISKSSELDSNTKISSNISDLESSLLHAEIGKTETTIKPKDIGNINMSQMVVKQTSNFKSNVGNMVFVDDKSNGNTAASFVQPAVNEPTQFEVGATLGVRRRTNPVTTSETGTFRTIENTIAEKSTGIGNAATSKRFSEMTSRIVSTETSGDSGLTGSNSPIANIMDNSGTISDISSNTVNISTTSSMNVQNINQTEPIIPHVSDLSSEGLFPFEGSLSAMDATLSEGIPAILDMTSVLEGHEPLHIEPTTNMIGEIITGTASAHPTISGIYAVANSGFVGGGQAQTNRSGTENTVIGFISSGEQPLGNNKAMEVPIVSNIDTIGKVISLNSENTLVESGLDRKTAISDANPSFVYAETLNNTSKGLEVAMNNNININRNTTNSQGALNININTAVTDADGVALSRFSGAPITNMIGVSTAQVNGGIAVSGKDAQSFGSNSPLASSSQELSASVDQISIVENADISSGSFVVGADRPNSKIISTSSVGGLAIGSGNPDIKGISLPQRAFREDQRLNQNSKATDSTKSVKVDMSSFIPPPFEETTGNFIANQQQFNFQENLTDLAVSKDKSTLRDIENNLQNIRNQIAQLQPPTATVQTDEYYNFNSEMFGAADTSSLSLPEARRTLTPNTVSATGHFGKTPNGNALLNSNQANKNPTLTTNVQYNDGVSSNMLKRQNVEKATITNSNTFKSLSGGTNSQQSGTFSDLSSIQNNRFTPLSPINQNAGGISLGQFSDKPLIGNIFGGVDSTSTETKANVITQKFLEKTGITREPAVDFMSSFLKPSLSSAKSNIKNVDIIQLESAKLNDKALAANSDANIVDQFGVADIYTRKQELNPAQWQQFMAQNSHVAKAGQNVGNIDYVTKNVVGKEERRPLNENVNNKRSFTDISSKRSDAVMTQTNVDINNQFLTGTIRTNENIGNQERFTGTTRLGEGTNNQNLIAKKTKVIESIDNQNSFTGTRGLMPRRETSDRGNETPKSRNTDRSGSKTAIRQQTLDSAIIFEAPGMTGHKSVTIVNYRPNTFEPYQASKSIFNADIVGQQDLRNVKGVSQQRPMERPESNIAVNQQQLGEFVGSQTIAQRSSEFANSLQQNKLNGGTQSIVKAGMLSQGGRQAGSDQTFGSFSIPTGTAGSASSVIALDQDQLTSQLTLDQGQLGETGKRIQDEMNTFKLGKSILISDGVIPDFAGPNSIHSFQIDATDMQSLSEAGMRLGEPSVLPKKVPMQSGTPANAQSTFIRSPSTLNGGTNNQNVQSLITTTQMIKSDSELSSRNNVNPSNRNLGIAINENMNANGIIRQENRMLPTNQLINQKNVEINNQHSDSVFRNDFSRRANNKGASFGVVDQNEQSRNTGLGRLNRQQAGASQGQKFLSPNVGIAVSDVFEVNSSTFDESFTSSTNMQTSGDNARMSKPVQPTSSDTAAILGLNDALVKQPMEPTLFTSGNRFAVFGHANDVAGKSAVKQMTKPIPARRMGVLAPVHDCRYKPDPTSEYYFIFKNGITQHRFRCALGTAFDEMTCECSIRVSDHGDCLEVHMDFNNGVVEDSSLNRLPIGNENVEITNSSSPLPGIALFSGNSKLTIWRYQNYDFRDHIMLKVQFRPGVGGDRNQPLITNCDGSANRPAVGIVYDNVMQEVVLLLQTVNDTGKELRFSVNANEWNDVTYIYDGQEFIGIVNGVRRYVSRENPHLLGIIGGEIKSTPAQGLIEIQDAAIVLGHCPMFGYFRGAMVDIQIYTCIPKDFRLE